MTSPHPDVVLSTISRPPREERPEPTALTDAQIAEFWDWDISVAWVRERLAARIREAGFIVIPDPDKDS